VPDDLFLVASNHDRDLVNAGFDQRLELVLEGGLVVNLAEAGWAHPNRVLVSTRR
jgi:hypothetical protein